MSDEGLKLSITETDIPRVQSDDGLSQSASTAKLAKTAADQELLAKQAVIKQALAMIDIGIVYGTGYVTQGRVSHEAALTKQEKEALAAVWAPLITVASPLTVAILTTGGILTAKTVAVMKMNDERKLENDEREQPTGDNRTEPVDDSGRSGGVLPFSGDIENPGDGPSAGIPNVIDIASPTGNDGSDNGGDD